MRQLGTKAAAVGCRNGVRAVSICFKVWLSCVSVASPSAVADRALVGTWVFVLSDAVGFAALLSTVVALRAGSESFANAPPAHLGMGLLATAILLGISALLIVARRFPQVAKRGMAGASLLAFGFCILQGLEYRSMIGHPLVPGQESFLVVTGYHLAHVVGGFFALLWGLTRSTLPLGPLSLYWHFVDGLWLVIFLFFYLL